MSQAENKVKWCLEKARKELATSDTHRGLVKTASDERMARLHIAKAEHNLNAALFFDKNGYSDWSASAFFYCIYHCFLAIIRKYGYESRNQECTIALIEALIEEGTITLDQKFLKTLKIGQVKEENLIMIREEFQYGVETAFEHKEQINKLTQLCKEAIAATQRIVFNKGSSS
jgi:uncharacterized protein (UPF0332 family)